MFCVPISSVSPYIFVFVPQLFLVFAPPFEVYQRSPAVFSASLQACSSASKERRLDLLAILLSSSFFLSHFEVLLTFSLCSGKMCRSFAEFLIILFPVEDFRLAVEDFVLQLLLSQAALLPLNLAFPPSHFA